MIIYCAFFYSKGQNKMLSHESRCESCFEACKRLLPETCSHQTKLLRFMVQFSCVTVKQSTGLCTVQSSVTYWLMSKVKMVCKTHVRKILVCRVCFGGMFLSPSAIFPAMDSPRQCHGGGSTKISYSTPSPRMEEIAPCIFV